MRDCESRRAGFNSGRIPSLNRKTGVCSWESSGSKLVHRVRILALLLDESPGSRLDSRKSGRGANPAPRTDRRTSEPVGQEAGIDPAEVGVELQVAVVEVVQTRMFAHQARLGDRSDEEDRRRRAVVRPVRGVLLYPAPEFAEGQDATRSAWPAAVRSS